LLVDIANPGVISAANFQFATSDGVNPFVASSATATITMLSGQGDSGSTRVKIEFADNAVLDTWLRVTVIANATKSIQRIAG